MKYILVIGKNKEIMDTLTRLINKKTGWAAIPSFSVEESLIFYEGTHIDLVLLSGGLTRTEENKIKKAVRKVPVVQHYGGGSGLLYNELQANLVTA